MSKGRRAADRRREREGQRIVLDDGLTDPGRSSTSHQAKTQTTLAAQSWDDPEAELRDALDGSLLAGAPIETTAVRPRPAQPSPRGGALVVRTGPDAGQTFVLVHTPSHVGRSPDGQVVLNDSKVSRYHAVLVYDDVRLSWTLADRGSRSGTLHNGKVVEEPVAIAHGDLLHLGESELRFLAHEQMPTALPAPPMPPEDGERAAPLDDDDTELRTRPGARASAEPTEVRDLKPPPGATAAAPRRAAVVALLLVLLIAGGVGGGYLWWARGPVDDAQIALQTEALLTDARHLLDRGALEPARARLETVLVLSPADKTAESLLRMIDGETEAREVLRQAQALADEGKQEQALALLPRIADSSVFAIERDQLRANMLEKERRAALRDIETLAKARRFREAKERLTQHLQRFPSDEAAKAWLRRIEQGRELPEPDTAAVVAARRALGADKLTQARALAEPEARRGGRAAQRYLADLDTFEAALQKGERAIRVMDSGTSLAAFERALVLLGRLSDKKPRQLSGRVATGLANSLYAEGMAKQRRGDRCGYAADLLRAYTLKGADEKIRTQKRAIDTLAQEGLTRARAVQGANPERAAQVAREHLCFATEDSRVGIALRAMLR